MNTEPRVTAEQVAQHLGVVKDTVYRWRDRKTLPAHKIGRLWKFQLSEIDEWVHAGGADKYWERRNVDYTAAVWDGSIKNCVYQNHFIRVRVDSSQKMPLYASLFINSPDGRQQMFRAGETTSGLNTISSKNVKETIVAIPPLGLQIQFTAIVEKIEGIKSRYQQSLTDLGKIYGASSQQAFKGELDFSRVPLTTESRQ